MTEDVVHLPRESALCAVPVVFYGVVCATDEQLGDLCPAIAHLLMRHDEDCFFLTGPGVFADAGVKLVVPPVIEGPTCDKGRVVRRTSEDSEVSSALAAALRCGRNGRGAGESHGQAITSEERGDPAAPACDSLVPAMISSLRTFRGTASRSFL